MTDTSTTVGKQQKKLYSYLTWFPSPELKLLLFSFLLFNSPRDNASKLSWNSVSPHYPSVWPLITRHLFQMFYHKLLSRTLTKTRY